MEEGGIWNTLFTLAVAIGFVWYFHRNEVSDHDRLKSLESEMTVLRDVAFEAKQAAAQAKHDAAARPNVVYQQPHQLSDAEINAYLKSRQSAQRARAAKRAPFDPDKFIRDNPLP